MVVQLFSRLPVAFLAIWSFQSVFGGDRSCKGNIDCQLNGVCLIGVCHCDAAWRGSNCSVVNLLPARPLSKQGFTTTDTWSSWGGNINMDTNGTWHLFAAEMGGHCGLQTWGGNSRCVRATSKDPEGPYVREEV